MCNYLAMHPAHLRFSHLRLVGDPAVYKHQLWVSVSIVQFTSMVILTRTLTDEHKSSFSCYCWIPCNPLISTGLRSVLSPDFIQLFSTDSARIDSPVCSLLTHRSPRCRIVFSYQLFILSFRDQFNLESQTLASKLPSFWILLLGQVSFLFYHVLNTLNVDIKI